jgi:hypothetical protein
MKTSIKVRIQTAVSNDLLLRYRENYNSATLQDTSSHPGMCCDIRIIINYVNALTMFSHSLLHVDPSDP